MQFRLFSNDSPHHTASWTLQLKISASPQAEVKISYTRDERTIIQKLAGESLSHDPLTAGLNHLRGVLQPKLFHNSMVFFTLWSQSLSSSSSFFSSLHPSNKFLLSLPLVMAMTRTALPSACRRGVGWDWYPSSCLGTLSRLCLCFALACRNVATHTRYPHSVLALCSHCKAVLDAVVCAHRDPEHLSTAQQ